MAVAALSALGPLLNVCFHDPIRSLGPNVRFRPIADIGAPLHSASMDCHLSKALQLYIGFGDAPFPQENAQAVTAKIGPDLGFHLISRTRAVLREAGDLRPDWETMSLLSGKEWAEREIKDRYPELSETAVSAVGWAFSYWWK